MFSFLQGKMLTVVGSVALCALIWGGLATKLYVSSQKDLSSLQEQYSRLMIDYDSLAKERDKLLEDDKKKSEVMVDLIEATKQLDKQREEALGRLDKFRCPKPRIVSNEVTSEEVDVTQPYSIEFRNALRLPAPNP